MVSRLSLTEFVPCAGCDRLRLHVGEFHEDDVYVRKCFLGDSGSNQF